MLKRRRQKLVDRFQSKVVVRMVAYLFIYQLTLYNLLFCWRLTEHGGGTLSQQFGLFFQEFWPTAICFAILVPAFCWDSVKFLHRVAGPVYRFKQTVRDIAAERPVRFVRLREGDELLELQDDFNDMLDTLLKHGAITLAESAPPSGAESAPEIAILSCDAMPEEPTHAAS